MSQVQLSLLDTLVYAYLYAYFNFHSQKYLYWLRNISVPLKKDYKDELKWWFGVELARRLIFLLLFVPLPTTNVSLHHWQVIIHAFLVFDK